MSYRKSSGAPPASIARNAAATPEPQVLARRIALAALEHYADAGKQDHVVVMLLSGYDIGIASSMQVMNYVYTPEEWRTQQEKR